MILDPSELKYVGDALTAKGKPIDMVYNRLVDFALDARANDALRQAYLDGAVVVTPNPRAHALMADKRNLILLSDSQTLRDWGLNEDDAEYLESAVPKTRQVSASDAAELWSARRELFFKPVAAARVYQGQTTNFRTPGGGFAPVFSGVNVCLIPISSSAAHHTTLTKTWLWLGVHGVLLSRLSREAAASLRHWPQRGMNIGTCC
ncbi:hypothetical protein GCM10011533_34500 [Streptosporangium jomthongense]|nr:hypothetical protein GCM10011533_34500 [Streptosporangium jomthongense]